jgi:hypothetical protein
LLQECLQVRSGHVAGARQTNRQLDAVRLFISPARNRLT